MLVRNLLIALAITVVALTAATVWLTQMPQETGLMEKMSPAAGEALVGGAFALTDASGKEIRDTDFRGRYMLVFFGFTHCPDICPTTMSAYGEALKLLGNKAGMVAPVFISVDPERDTPKRLKEYGQSFDPRIVMLTGNKEQTEAVARAYKVYAAKASEGQDYLMDHSGIVYLMNRDGKLLRYFLSDSQSPERLAAALSEIIEKGM